MNTEENELDSTCGISDEELTRRFVEAVRIENEIKKVTGCPIPDWDEEKQLLNNKMLHLLLLELILHITYKQKILFLLIFL